MFERISRSYALVKHSWSVLVQDKELMVFPVLSGLASLFTMGSFLVPIVVYLMRQGPEAKLALEGNAQLLWYPYLFAFYLLTFFATYFFNTAVMCCAAIRMDGGDPTVKDGLRGAARHVGRIFAWAALSATIGLLLRTIEERAPLVGRIIAALVGCAWSVVTYFAIPTLIFEGVGVGAAMRRSAQLLKRSWGEAMIANVGLGLVFQCLALLGFVPLGLGMYLGARGAPVGMAIFFGTMAVVYWLTLAVIGSALSSIFRVAVYRYAATGTAPAGYPDELLRGAFRPRKRR